MDVYQVLRWLYADYHASLHDLLLLGVLLLELVSMQQRALGTPSSLTQTEALTTLALQSIIRCCKVGSLIFGIRKNG
ncbi:hypothetical protein ACQJBY_015620 [Aegilops geniculata]